MQLSFIIAEINAIKIN